MTDTPDHPRNEPGEPGEPGEPVDPAGATDPVETAEATPSTDPTASTDPGGPSDPLDDLDDLLVDPADDTADDTAGDTADDTAGAGADGPDAADPVDEAAAGTLPPPDPARQQAWVARRRLVRDPYTRLGGVASGLANHFGVDVSILRILFVLFTLATSGFGILAYLLAWLIIPRADHWPPGGVPARPFQSLTKRDIGLGLAAVGVLTILAFGGGTTGSFLVPLILVGGGVWLLMQPDNGVPSTVAYSGATADAATGGAGGGGPIPPMAYSPTPPGPPVPPPSRRRRGLVAALLLIPLTIFVLLPVALIAVVAVAAATGDIDLNIEGESVRYMIDDLDDLPLEVDVDAGEVVIDLTELDIADFADETAPASVELSMAAGDVSVYVPEDLPVEVRASAGFGDVQVFDSSNSGVNPSLQANDSDPVVELDLEINFGAIEVERVPQP